MKIIMISVWWHTASELRWRHAWSVWNSWLKWINVYICHETAARMRHATSRTHFVGTFFFQWFSSSWLWMNTQWFIRKFKKWHRKWSASALIETRRMRSKRGFRGWCFLIIHFIIVGSDLASSLRLRSLCDTISFSVSKSSALRPRSLHLE